MSTRPPFATKISFALALAALAACNRSREPAPAPATSSAHAASEAAPFDAGSLGVGGPAPERVVAIGDLHGDLDAARRALRLAGAIDQKDAWVGGKLVVVQTGDQIDRGDDDRKVLDLFERLIGDAEKAGGKVIALSGNHELMNVQFDFRYVTPGAFAEFADVTTQRSEAAPLLNRLDRTQRGRGAAFVPGGTYATMLARRPVVARVGDDLFVHGGILPKHVKRGLDGLIEGTRAWLEGRAPSPPRDVVADDGLVWTRMYSAAPGREECATLDETLRLLGAKRLIMGHTIQKPGIQPACDGRAWRIDVGMSRAYGGPIQVLELKADAPPEVLREAPPPTPTPSNKPSK